MPPPASANRHSRAKPPGSALACDMAAGRPLSAGPGTLMLGGMENRGRGRCRARPFALGGDSAGGIAARNLYATFQGFRRPVAVRRTTTLWHCDARGWPSGWGDASCGWPSDIQAACSRSRVGPEKLGRAGWGPRAPASSPAPDPERWLAMRVRCRLASRRKGKPQSLRRSKVRRKRGSTIALRNAHGGRPRP